MYSATGSCKASNLIHKLCTTCGLEKDVTEFHRDRQTKDGLHSRCALCANAAVRKWNRDNPERAAATARRYYQKNKEKCAAGRRRHYEEHKEERKVDMKRWREANKEKLVADGKRYYLENKERINATNRGWREANRERVAATDRKWQMENPERRRAIGARYRDKHPEVDRRNWHRYRALKLGAAGDATVEQIAARWEVYGETCYICGSPAEATDHVKPLAAGGANFPANLRPICTRCNSVKGAIWPYNFTAARQELTGLR